MRVYNGLTQKSYNTRLPRQMEITQKSENPKIQKTEKPNAKAARVAQAAQASY